MNEYSQQQMLEVITNQLKATNSNLEMLLEDRESQSQLLKLISQDMYGASAEESVTKVKKTGVIKEINKFNRIYFALIPLAIVTGWLLNSLINLKELLQ